jgi:8-oxo-dGTP diphosphatase
MFEKPYSLAVRAIIRDAQGRCLLLRRSSNCKHFVGTWEWPGGKADRGEGPGDAVQREVREETGLRIELTGVAGAFGIELAELRMAVLCMEARFLGGTVLLSEEHDDSAWVTPADMLQWNLTDGLRQFAERYITKA